jgi:hypothetical protein
MPLEATQKPYKPSDTENTGEGSKFTHVGLEKPAKKKIAILATIRGGSIKSLVGEWADLYWEQAKEAGLVTDAMINSTPIVPTETKGRNQRSRMGASA